MKAALGFLFRVRLGFVSLGFGLGYLGSRGLGFNLGYWVKYNNNNNNILIIY